MWPFFLMSSRVLGLLYQLQLLTVVSDRITKVFTSSGATWVVELDISNFFDRVWYAGLLSKLNFYGILGKILDFISSFVSKRRLQVVLDGKLWEEFQSALKFLKGPFMVLLFSYCTLMTFLMMLSVVLLSTLMILLSMLNVISDLICGNY